MPINGEWKNPALRRCDRKAAYPNWKVAEAVAQKVSVRIGELIIAYHCFHCGRFHIGHADRSQIIVRENAARPKARARGPIALPDVCPHCGKGIPEDRRRAARKSRTPTVYCSRRCQQNGSRKARRARREAAGTGNGSGAGADAATV